MRIFTFECGTATLDPPKEFSKEQTVILLFDPEEPAPVCLLAGGSRHTAQGSLEPWDYATEIGPRAHDGNSYVWMAPSGPKLIRCILGFIRIYVPSLRSEGLRRAWSRVDHSPQWCCRNHSGWIIYDVCPRVHEQARRTLGCVPQPLQG